MQVWAQRWLGEVHVHFWHIALCKGMFVCSVMKRHKESHYSRDAF